MYRDLDVKFSLRQSGHMTTSQVTRRTVLFDRLAKSALDHDGDIYGDERARLRWYEGIAVTSTVQWILVLWVLAVCAWLAPVSAAPALWCIAVAFVVPMYLALSTGRGAGSRSCGQRGRASRRWCRC